MGPRNNRQIINFVIWAIFLCLFVWQAADVEAARLKDIADFKGVRNNQLIGYGLVVGLDGTGDGNNAAFTNQSLVNMMNNLGVPVNQNDVNVKNVASVMITAQLPPFVKVGQTIDVTLSSLGDASSLQGGTLLPTPLKGLNGKVYGLAQGPVSIGGFRIQGPTVGLQRKHLTVARIPSGATVEKEVPVVFAGRKQLTLSLKKPDFTTVERMVEAVNIYLGGPYAAAIDGATVQIAVPESYEGLEISLLASLEGLQVNPDNIAKVVLDERTGTVVMGENVRIGEIALSHGNLSLQISGANARRAKIEGDAGNKLVSLPTGASLGEIVRALNSMGVSPRDMIAIFQSIKAAGALQAELEII